MLRHHYDVVGSRQRLLSSTAHASLSSTEHTVLYKITRDNNHYHENELPPILNPDAVEFEPSLPRLATIEEEEMSDSKEDTPSFTYTPITSYTYCASQVIWEPQPLYPYTEVLRPKYVVFIPGDITKHAIETCLFHEYFPTANDLFYFLRYQCRMQAIDKLYKLFASYDDQELVLFNTELHTSGTQFVVYIVGVPNDHKGKKSAVKWKMVHFMTAQDIYETYGIKHTDLPSGSRWKLYQNTDREMMRYKRDMIQFKNALHTVQMQKYLMHVGQIKSEKKSSHPLLVTPRELMESMKVAINRDYLRPIVWFNKNKHRPQYRIQMLLRIEIICGHWIGATFDYDENNELYVDKICVDDTDIRRKLTLFEPSHDENESAFFSSDIREISITKAETKQYLVQQNETIWRQTKQIKYLENAMRDKDVQIEKLKRRLIV